MKSLEVNSISQSADNSNNSKKNNTSNPDIITESNAPYFPPCYEAPLIGMFGMDSSKKGYKEFPQVLPKKVEQAKPP